MSLRNSNNNNRSVESLKHIETHPYQRKRYQGLSNMTCKTRDMHRDFVFSKSSIKAIKVTQIASEVWDFQKISTPEVTRTRMEDLLSSGTASQHPRTLKSSG